MGLFMGIVKGCYIKKYKKMKGGVYIPFFIMTTMYPLLGREAAMMSRSWRFLRKIL